MPKIRLRTTAKALRSPELQGSSPSPPNGVGTFIRPLHIGVKDGRLYARIDDIDGSSITDSLTREQSVTLAVLILHGAPRR